MQRVYRDLKNCTLHKTVSFMLTHLRKESNCTGHVRTLSNIATKFLRSIDWEEVSIKRFMYSIFCFCYLLNIYHTLSNLNFFCILKIALILIDVWTANKTTMRHMFVSDAKNLLTLMNIPNIFNLFTEIYDRFQTYLSTHENKIENKKYNSYELSSYRKLLTFLDWYSSY